MASGALIASNASASALACNGRWQLQQPSDVHDEEFLQAVSALSVDDAWAVGSFADGSGPLTPLFQHWDGATWNEVPGAPLPDGLLSGVRAVSSTDVWAVGGRQQTLPAKTLTEHWDGSSWTVVPSPSPGLRSHGSWLHGVDAVSSTDVWAVGSRGVQDGDRTLVEHWDGSSWRKVSSANVPGMDSNILQSVSAIDANDVWAAGYALSNSDFVAHTLTLHWDGTSWSVVPSPDASDFGDLLYGVSGSSGSDVWAVGRYADAFGDIYPLTEHWDGTSWTVVQAVPGETATFLYAVSTGSTGSTGKAWTVGNSSKLVTEFWNGSRWKHIAAVSPGTVSNYLFGVDALSDRSVFAVGYFYNGDQYAYPLAEYFC
jgi:hypothetical protein